MPYLNRDGVNLFYQATGSGPTVLLSHGYSATSFMWRGQVAVLSDRYQVVVWDVRGHGLSDSPDDASLYSEALTLEDMAAILDHLEVDRAVIGGLSLGGYLSLAFNVVYPERVNALALFDTGPGYRKVEGREQWNELARGRARFFRRKGLEAIEARDDAHGGQHRSSEGLALAAEGILQQSDSRVIDSLPSIKVPTLVLAGAEDTPFLAATDYMASHIPGARKVILANAGHEANLDQPEEFNAALGDFLEASV